MKELGLWILVFIVATALAMFEEWRAEKNGTACPVGGSGAAIIWFFFMFCFIWSAIGRFFYLLVAAWF